MGNKKGKLLPRSPSSSEERQRLLTKSEVETGISAKNLAYKKNISSKNLMGISNAGEMISPENLVESSNTVKEVPVGVLVDLSEVEEYKVPGNLVESSSAGKDVPSEDLIVPSNVKKDVPVCILVDIPSAVESDYPKNLNWREKHLLDNLTKLSNDLKKISLDNLSLQNLVKLLNAEEDSPLRNVETPEGTSYQTPEELFRLRVFVRDCDESHSTERKCVGKLKYYECFAPVRGNISTACLIHFKKYNSQRKSVLDFTLIGSNITKGETMYFLFLWDSKQETWRLITPESNETERNKSYPEAEAWAQTVIYNQSQSDFIECLSQSTLCTNLPLHITESFESEVHITTYNARLEKLFDLSLVEGKKHDHWTEYYVECRGSKNGGHSFVARNDSKPSEH